MLRNASRLKLRHGSAILLLVGMLVCVGLPPASADDTENAKDLVTKSQYTIENFAKDSAMGGFRDLITRARGVLIIPQMIKGAFIFGASGGSGVLMVRDTQSGEWSQPAFYTIGGISFGLQAGGQASELVLLFMGETGVTSILDRSLKFGADASVAAGPVGAGASGQVAGLSADVVSFALNTGLFAGVSLDGAVVEARDLYNEAYYGLKLTPTDIVIRRVVRKAETAALIEAVTKVSQGAK
jgi:lipid-binding SYLF domain-containing protein